MSNRRNLCGLKSKFSFKKAVFLYLDHTGFSKWLCSRNKVLVVLRLGIKRPTGMTSVRSREIFEETLETVEDILWLVYFLRAQRAAAKSNLMAIYTVLRHHKWLVGIRLGSWTCQPIVVVNFFCSYFSALHRLYLKHWFVYKSQETANMSFGRLSNGYTCMF